MKKPWEYMSDRRFLAYSKKVDRRLVKKKTNTQSHVYMTCRGACGSRDDCIPQCRYYGVGFHWIHITESKIQFYKH